MKKTLLTLMLATMLAFTARGQVLQNTYWRAYTLTNFATQYWYFGQDTLFNSNSNSNYIPLSTFTTNGNIITIVDIPSPNCPLIDTGAYGTLIMTDTLYFN